LSDRRETILIKGRVLRYRVRRNRRARGFRVNVSPGEGVVVVIPWRTSLKEVPPMMEKWGPWLEEKADKFGCWQGPLIKQYASGSQLLVLGKPRVLDLSVLPAGKSRARVTLEGETLRLVVQPEDIWDPRPVLEKWLRRFARQELEDRVKHWSEVTGLSPARIIIGERKTRWGSCSSRGTLSFCYRLIMAPPEVVDAIVIHELCHLVHMNHSRRFYSLFERYCPDHEDAEKWLRENHDELLL
jgi:predicted metal-dependent hydrolase